MLAFLGQWEKHVTTLLNISDMLSVLKTEQFWFIYGATPSHSVLLVDSYVQRDTLGWKVLEKVNEFGFSAQNFPFQHLKEK